MRSDASPLELLALMYGNTTLVKMRFLGWLSHNLPNNCAPELPHSGPCSLCSFAHSCMIDVLVFASDWFMGLGDAYGVDPLIFGSLYVGTIPFFWGSVVWLVRNVRKGYDITAPALSTMVFMVLAYVYLFWTGENLPVWIYLMVAATVGYGVVATIQKVRAKARACRTARAVKQATRASAQSKADRPTNAPSYHPA